ncbi:glycosyltransferase [Shouchella lonarensis]|uniref:Glycosyl transferase family 2 n=1 Tax=Shouchella lonarensis TaxID=1464122 RepID=A0A1G6HAU7_9BACI|nr:glycosyltransferase family 2 protein [Shouchella lonarensis]SDB90556.1 Glycosyl transferase family 2 [Shouchella lonarensis]
MKKQMRVLIGSPVNQTPQILRPFLDMLSHIEQETISIDYLFLDDNDDHTSRARLQTFAKKTARCIVRPSTYPKTMPYHKDDMTHGWDVSLVKKVATFKNDMIQYAIEKDYDYLFLIDSDVLIHPHTIEHLVQTEKDIVCEVYWTQWQPESIPLPQVWMCNQYDLFRREEGEELSASEESQRNLSFLKQLKKPGLYEVGGLGACTLISNKALTAGVNFNDIHNLSLLGEDRHFCVRAVALGFPLFVDTHYPAYHIYREADLAGVTRFKKACGLKEEAQPVFEQTHQAPTIQTNNRKQKLTLSMVMKNEADRYLQRVLEEHKQYIDAAVIIDDGSDDDSVAICQDVLQGIPLYLVQNNVSAFENEINLRKQQWHETIKTDPGWILNVDADEMFESRFKNHIHALIETDDYDTICFRLYDFWDDTHYREDPFWCAHLTYRPFLVKYDPSRYDTWHETPLHCGRFPKNVLDSRIYKSSLRLKHFGWAKEADRIKKYERYLQHDPDGTYGVLEQYHSILDTHPRLIKWEE